MSNVYFLLDPHVWYYKWKPSDDVSICSWVVSFKSSLVFSVLNGSPNTLNIFQKCVYQCHSYPSLWHIKVRSMNSSVVLFHWHSLCIPIVITQNSPIPSRYVNDKKRTRNVVSHANNTASEHRISSMSALAMIHSYDALTEVGSLPIVIITVNGLLANNHITLFDKHLDILHTHCFGLHTH
jgi:hypothetical protein